jgi:hypothetical protein
MAVLFWKMQDISEKLAIVSLSLSSQHWAGCMKWHLVAMLPTFPALRLFVDFLLITVILQHE